MRFVLFTLLLLGSAAAAVPESPFITYLIESAEAKIKKAPTAAEGYADLAFALGRRARETEDASYWNRAEGAIRTALKLDPTNFEARKARVIIRIQQGRLADAEEEGRALNKQTPDDNLVYGLLADVALERGRYPEAEALTQRMLDLRQVNGPGLQRAARVREIIGFPDGAGEFWMSALRLASSSDLEERAYLLTQLSGLFRRRARLEDAGRYASEALSLEPGYPAALLEQGRVALEQQRPKIAAADLEKRLEQGFSLSAQYWLTVALETMGNTTDAQKSGERFLTAARNSSVPPAKRDELLIRYLTAHGQAVEAASIGKDAVQMGASLSTEEAYAMALLEAGEPEKAAAQMERVLKPGIQNPEYFLHAATIRRRNHDAERAALYLRKCIEINASSRFAEIALRELQKPN